MSVFDDETKHQEDGTNQTNETQTESYLQKLIEEKGDKWSDPEVIAKGKFESDKHIKELERQLREMREDLTKNEYAKTLLETLNNKAGDPPKTSESNTTNTEDQNTTDTKSEDLESLVEEALRKREATNTRKQNIDQVDEAMVKAFGTEATKVVREKASELGMTVERLQEIAAESPSAFLRLIGEAPAKETNTQTSSSVNSSAVFSSSSKRDWNYYQDIRRKSPSQYYSPKIQNQLAKDAAEQGSKFYSN